MTNAIVLALALSAAPASALSSGSRRLRDSVDLPKLYEASGKGQLGTKIHYKLDAAAAAASGADAVAGEVASKLDCDKTPSRIFRAAGKHEAAHKAAGLDLWYEVKCAHEAGDKFTISRDVMAKLEAYLDSDDHTGVQLIEPELEHATSWSPNDPELNQQPHYDTVKMQGAWDVTKGLQDVVVQVLDTGIDMAHPDLQMNIWRNEGEICNNGIDDDNNGFVDDCHGYNHADDTGTDLLGNHWHGTHCGGTVAADSNNGVGVAGVAGGDGTPDSGVKLMISVGFGDTSVGGFAEALVYGADNGAHVSSNSWGYTAPGAYEQTVLDAIDYYNARVTAAGVADGTVVFAAGNDASSGAYYPGFYDGTVAVAAVDTSMIAAGFTNYGSHIDISAPGVSVYSTMTGDGYGYASGTSMACPHVAGILALGKSVDFFASREKLLNCMTSTAMNIDPINGAKAGLLGAGNMDAEAFVGCVANGTASAAPTVSFAPTTAPPSLSPTVSMAPTPNCDCDQTLELALLTDKYPGETTWTLKAAKVNPGCEDHGPWKGGPYQEQYKKYEEKITAKICGGQTYNWEIKDSYGDGICCLEGDGQYSLVLNGGVIHSGGEYGAGEKFTFEAPLDPSETTPQPTFGSIEGPTPSPTMSNTTPPDDDDGWGDDDDVVAPEPIAPLQVAEVSRIMSHKKLEGAALIAWTAFTLSDGSRKLEDYTYGNSEFFPDEEDGHHFMVEYRMAKDAPFETLFDGNRPFFLEGDDKFYAVFANAPCGKKVQIQVTGVGYDDTGMVYSNPKQSKPRKVKC